MCSSDLLPAAAPNLLLNGTLGIAVGMATNIPPHNLREVVTACVRLLDEPDVSSKELCKHVQGPDFPTGGIVIDSRESIVEAYKTGKGSFRVRARWSQEELARREAAQMPLVLGDGIPAET